MKNSTILFGLIILVYLLSMISKDAFNDSKEKNYFDNQYKTDNVKIQPEEQLPIISFKRD